MFFSEETRKSNLKYHIDIPDIDDIEEISLEEDLSSSPRKNLSLNVVNVGDPIGYYESNKTFFHYYNRYGNDVHRIGVGLSTNLSTNLVDVMYRHFLYQNPISMPNDVGERFYQCYVKKLFTKAKDLIKQEMPSIKKLKRLNLKVITPEHVNLISQNFDLICTTLENMYDPAYADNFKASVMTTPTYVYDPSSDLFYIYHFDEQKYHYLSLEHHHGNFLCYFTYHINGKLIY